MLAQEKYMEQHVDFPNVVEVQNRFKFLVDHVKYETRQAEETARFWDSIKFPSLLV
jgi:hypothetical protein